MAEMFVFTVDYRKYAISVEDATALMILCRRLIAVDKPNWQDDHYTREERQRPLITTMELAEVRDPVPVPVPTPDPTPLAIEPPARQITDQTGDREDA